MPRDFDAAVSSGELAFLSAGEASRMFLARKLSPVELVDAFLARIAKVDAKVKSYIHRRWRSRARQGKGGGGRNLGGALARAAARHSLRRQG